MESARLELFGIERALDRSRLLQLCWLSLLWSLLLGPSLSMPASFFTIDLLLSNHLLGSGRVKVDFTIIRLWIVSNLFFYSAGHTTTFSGIPFYATAVGFSTHSTQFIPFLMVLVNAYGCHIIGYKYITRWVTHTH